MILKNEQTQELVTKLVLRRKELKTTIIPTLKQQSKDSNIMFQIWDSENEVKEINWLLGIFTNKGYTISD